MTDPKDDYRLDYKCECSHCRGHASGTGPAAEMSELRSALAMVREDSNTAHMLLDKVGKQLQQASLNLRQADEKNARLLEELQALRKRIENERRRDHAKVVRLVLKELARSSGVRATLAAAHVEIAEHYADLAYTPPPSPPDSRYENLVLHLHGLGICVTRTAGGDFVLEPPPSAAQTALEVAQCVDTAIAEHFGQSKAPPWPSVKDIKP